MENDTDAVLSRSMIFYGSIALKKNEPVICNYIECTLVALINYVLSIHLASSQLLK